MTPRSVSTLAPAKINLFLRILHRRPDGFREVETVFQSVSLADSVAVSVTDGDGVSPDERLTLSVVGADVGPERENLAWRAAERFRTSCVPGLAISIRLTKRIPAGAGLGGGSSDAAAVLRCLAAITRFDDTGALHGIAADLGSDVPFFLESSGVALGRGRGEALEALKPLPVRKVVLALPPVHVSTVEAYRALGATRMEHGSGTGVEVEVDPHGGPRDFVANDLSNWDSLDEVAHNDFEPLVAGRHEEIRRSLDALRAAGADVTLLSGSGGACFGLFDTSTDVGAVADALSDSTGWPFVACSTLPGAPHIEVDREG